MCRLISNSVLLAIAFGAFTSAQAQFREVTPGVAKTKDSKEFVETKQRFQTPQTTAKTSAKPSDADTKLPTPAVRNQGTQSPSTPAAVASPKQKDTVAREDTSNKATKTSKRHQTTMADEKSTKVDAKSIDLFSLFQKPELDDTTVFGSIQFNGIDVGESTIADVRKLWGRPVKTVEVDGAEKLIYGAPDVRQIGIIADGVAADDSKLNVQSIVFHLDELSSITEIVERLDIEEIQSVAIAGEVGDVIGFAYPEFGVLLGLEDDQAVTTISIEPVSSEFFVMRAEDQTDHDYSQDLLDLITAVEIDGSDAHAYWLMAELLSKIGRMDDAQVAVTKAVDLSDEPLYRLTKARLEAEAGNHVDAVDETESVIDDDNCHDIVHAKAHYQLGNLLASGPEADFEVAMKSHLKAIDVAAKEMRNDDIKIRRMAKRLLVDSHLSVAQDIALGSFQRKEQVVPKWLIRATELAEDLIDSEAGDETIRLDIFRATLGIYSILPVNFDASIPAEDAIAESKRLIANSDDDIYHRTVQRKLIETLFYAAKVEQKRGRIEISKVFAQNAVSLLEDQNDEEQSTFDKYIAGQVYFLLGSVYAIGESDHKQAVTWYKKAQPIFEDESLQTVVNPTTFGEPLVSMGISFWEIGEKEKAIALTEKGSDLMQDAVQEGILPLETMAVPYGNLATMHKHLGNKKNANHFKEMMAKIETQKKVR